MKRHDSKPPARKPRASSPPSPARQRTRASAARPKPLSLRETPQQRKSRATVILRKLRRAYPDATCALHHRSPLELLVATILSAQCTDQRVNQVTPALFQKYASAADFAAAKPAQLEAMIRSTGFFRNKARNLIGMGKSLQADFQGHVPASMDELLTLPGVARKTANCALGQWYKKNEGIVVDTHVGRVALRLGLLSSATSDKDAVRIERDLMPLFPRKDWTFLAHAMIDHGRHICTARRPRCGGCPLAPDCPSAFAFDPPGPPI